jgi:hypothetical protein
VDAGGLGADEQLLGDLAVAAPGRHQRQDLGLPATVPSVRLSPGTLYRTIAPLLADGLVEEVEGGGPATPTTPAAATTG